MVETLNKTVYGRPVLHPLGRSKSAAVFGFPFLQPVCYGHLYSTRFAGSISLRTWVESGEAEKNPNE